MKTIHSNRTASALAKDKPRLKAKTFKKLALSSAISAAIFSLQANAGTLGARIVGGAEATPNTYPWMVSVQNKEEGEHFCGASLIDNTYVLTAAHCLESEQAENIQVVISEFDLKAGSNHEETLAVKKIYIHQGYDEDNDIAILELATASTKTPVKLADTALFNSLSPGNLLTVMGWGNMLSDGEKFPNLLHEVQVPLVSPESCKSSYANVDISISDNMVCAGLPEGGKDSCQGDSGGPLVYQKDSDWFQTGVVSFGEGCAEADYPGVYTKVSNYSEWIASVKAGEVPVHQPSDDEDDYDEDDFNEDDFDEDDFDEEEMVFGLPPYLDFFAQGLNDTAEETLVIFNDNEAPLMVQGISLDNDQSFSVINNSCDALTLNQNDFCNISISFTAVDSDEQETTLLISTSDNTYPEIEVALYGLALDEFDFDEGDFDEDDFDEEFDDEFDEGNEDESGHEVNVEWYSEGDQWSGDEEGGNFALACQDVSQNEDAVLMADVEGPGTLTFDMALSGDDPENSLVFMVDGDVVKTVSGQASNRSATSNSHTTVLSEGEHQVSWVYHKAVENTAAAKASIDNVAFESDESSNGDEGDEKPVGEMTVSEIVDEASGAGSTDGLLFGLLALLGLGLRKSKK